ncbi:MAG TPA: hypothetical protein VNS88_04260 [Nitrospiraceae bacterium]|nr:hypothetical protein [Nitrospiraceae bacterium]
MADKKNKSNREDKVKVKTTILRRNLYEAAKEYVDLASKVTWDEFDDPNASLIIAEREVESAAMKLTYFIDSHRRDS